MRDILHFVLLFAMFGSYSLFAVEQPKKELNKKNDANELQYKTYSMEMKKKLEKDLTELPKSNTADFDNLNVKKTRDKKIGSKKLDKSTVIKLEPLSVEDKEAKESEDSRKHSKSTVLDLEKTLNKSDKINKASEEHHKSTVNKLPDLKKALDEDDETSADLSKDPVTEPMIGDLLKKKDFLDTNLNDTAANLQKESKSDQINKSESLKSNIDQLLKENISKVESQAKEKDAERIDDTFEKHKQENLIDEKGKENEQEKLQKWTELKKEPVKEWTHKDAQGKAIYKRQYDHLNEHLPTTVFIHDYSKQLFYCIKKNNLSCLRGIIGKLEKIGLNIKEILKFRNHLGDTPLIYAVKQGEIDIVRFLLLQGSDLSLVNNNFHSAMDIAVKKKQVNIINSIAEMTPHLIERSRVNNKKDSTMYNWAMNTKENDESKCGEK